MERMHEASDVTGRLFIHLGPPKTATTSLQLALQATDDDWFVYGGVRQPRDPADRGMSWLLHEAACGRLERRSTEGESLVDSIRGPLQAGRHVLISQEMLLVRQPGIPFQSKIERLGRFLADLPVTTLLTFRDPESALRSYYQEIFQNLPMPQKLDYRRFCRDERTRIFDYKYMMDLLAQNGFSDIRLIDFNQLISGRVSYGDIFGAEARTRTAVPIPWDDTGRKDTDSDKRVLPAISARSLSSLPFVPLKLLQRLPGFALLRAGLDRIPLRPSRAQDLQVSPDLRERLEAGAHVARAALEAQARRHSENSHDG